MPPNINENGEEMRLVHKTWLSVRKRFFLLMGKRFFVKRVGPHRFLLDIRNRVDRFVESDGGYEKAQTRFLMNLLHEHACEAFFDIGAHWGYYAILLHGDSRFNGLRVVVFEPDRKNAYQLYANLFLNDLEDRIEVQLLGLSDHDGEAAFSRHHLGNRGASGISDLGTANIPVRRFDSLYQLQSQRLGFKIDVEGHELAVLAGMSDTLRDNFCVLQIELFQDKRNEFIERMRRAGYRNVEAIGNDHYFVKESS